MGKGGKGKGKRIEMRMGMGIELGRVNGNRYRNGDELLTIFLYCPCAPPCTYVPNPVSAMMTNTVDKSTLETYNEKMY
jgi:hypothetical protein